MFRPMPELRHGDLLQRDTSKSNSITDMSVYS